MAEETKQQWIREMVPGRTFADIGGLGGRAINEMVTTAMKAKAAKAAMVDVLPFSDPQWADFEARCVEQGVSGYECIQADLNSPGDIGPWEVVHCSGIIYHVPDPFTMLLRLRDLCKDRLIFTSMIVPEVLTGKAGTLDLRGGRAVFVPAMDPFTRGICAEYMDSLGIQILGINSDIPFKWMTSSGTVDYGPWWWLLPVDYLERMLTVVGFKVVTRQQTAPGAFSFICSRR